MWSLGIMCYTLVCGELHDFSDKPVTFDNPIWKEISNECKDFISGCLKKDPEERLDSIEGANQIWFLRQNWLSTHSLTGSITHLARLKSTRLFRHSILIFLVSMFETNEVK